MKKINKIIFVVWLNKFLFINKKNWFRNFLLNEKLIKEYSNKHATGDIQDLAYNLFTFPETKLSHAKKDFAFNNQKTRQDIVKKLFENIKFNEIVETGTYLGNTTDFFLQFNLPIKTVEISNLYYQISRIRFLRESNVEIFLSDSITFLKNCQNYNSEVFFYLDAHSHSRNLPLTEEIENCLKFKNSLILIDDFKVPGKNEFEYDTYEKFDLEINNYEILKECDLYFPNYNANVDAGRRGYILIDVSKKYGHVFQQIVNLKKYENQL